MTRTEALGHTAPRAPFWPPTILDRYLVEELRGPSLFGLSAFTLIFVATQILAIGRLVSEEHAPLWAAIEYFLWQMPYYLLLVIPMAMLLGTLLAMQRLSSESEINALHAGGVSLSRIVAPLLLVGVCVSLVALVLQEQFVPFANEKASYVRQAAIEHATPGLSNLQAVTSLPGGGKQVTIAGGLDAATQTLLNVTVIQYDARQQPQRFIVADRARFVAPTWTFENSTTYNFAPDGSVTNTRAPTMTIDIGARPSEMAKQSISITNPEDLSRAELKERLDSGQLAPQQRNLFRRPMRRSWRGRSRRSCSRSSRCRSGCAPRAAAGRGSGSDSRSRSCSSTT